jgi:hypothetical protein
MRDVSGGDTIFKRYDRVRSHSIFKNLQPYSGIQPADAAGDCPRLRQMGARHFWRLDHAVVLLNGNIPRSSTGRGVLTVASFTR